MNNNVELPKRFEIINVESRAASTLHDWFVG